MDIAIYPEGSIVLPDQESFYTDAQEVSTPTAAAMWHSWASPLSGCSNNNTSMFNPWRHVMHVVLHNKYWIPSWIMFRNSRLEKKGAGHGIKATPPAQPVYLESK